MLTDGVVDRDKPRGVERRSLLGLREFWLRAKLIRRAIQEQRGHVRTHMCWGRCRVMWSDDYDYGRSDGYGAGVERAESAKGSGNDRNGATLTRSGYHIGSDGRQL